MPCLNHSVSGPPAKQSTQQTAKQSLSKTSKATPKELTAARKPAAQKPSVKSTYSAQGSILAFFQTHQPGKYVRKDTCPDKILLARSKLRNNI